MKRHNYHYSPAHHYNFGLSAQQKNKKNGLQSKIKNYRNNDKLKQHKIKGHSKSVNCLFKQHYNKVIQMSKHYHIQRR